MTTTARPLTGYKEDIKMMRELNIIIQATAKASDKDN